MTELPTALPIEDPRQPMAGGDGGVVDNAWRRLQVFTDARIGLGRAGISLPTDRLLAFQLAHAQARDAVNLALDSDALGQAIAALDSERAAEPPVLVHTRAADRLTYLQRPDRGRRLDDASRKRLAPDDTPNPACDLSIVIVDGLSARAIHDHAAVFLDALFADLDADEQSWQTAPLVVVEHGRVAIGDEIGQLLNAAAVLVMVGERPGLSSPDSLGLYLTWNPRPGTTDAERNCISNVRPAGLDPAQASRRLMYLLREARSRKLTGVALKDRSDDDVIEQDGNEHGNFLVS